MNANDDGILELYISECSQVTQALEELLMEVENTGVFDSHAVSEAFRLVHTLKGSSGMMQFSAMEQTSHLLENVLSDLRRQAPVPLTDGNRELLEVSLDYVQYFFSQMERVGAGDKEELSQPLLDRLQGLTAGESRKIPAAPVQPVDATPAQLPIGDICLRLRIKKCPLPHVRSSILIRAASALCSYMQTVPAMLEDHPELGDDILENGFVLCLSLNTGVELDQVVNKLAAQPYYLSCERLYHQSPALIEQKKDALVQVSQWKINELLNRMDELLSAEAALSAALNKEESLSLPSKLLLTQLHSSLLEAQALSSEMSMVEIKVVFTQMRRLIRGMNQEFSKKIAVTIIGGDTLIDRSAVEILSEALIHIVRNAVDHGIESPKARMHSGKPETGNITMEASKKNQQIFVRVSDDGAGIHKAAIIQKAIELGMLDNQKTDLSDQEIYSILLTAGFSTSKIVTKYSGRGVGLDTAVKRIRNIGGDIHIDSTFGKGTTFTLQIPATIAVMEGLEVQAKGHRLLIPVNAIALVEDGHCQSGRLDCDGARFTGYESLSLLCTNSAAQAEEDGSKLIFFRRDYGRYYLRVHSIGKLRQVLIKPLPQYALDALGRACVFSGCAFLDNADKMICILDVQKLIDRKETMERGIV